jgi:endonuclease I
MKLSAPWTLCAVGLLAVGTWGGTAAAWAAAPSAHAGPDRTVILTGTQVTVSLSGAIADDADGFTGLSYAWTPATGTSISSWTARTGSVVTTNAPAAAQVVLTTPGTCAFTLTVTDPTALTATDTVTIFVLTAPAASVYDPPATYYDPARPGGLWQTGTTLKTSLRTIITTGIVSRNYDAARYSLQLLDQDPANPNNVINIYTGTSVLGTWDSGTTWNREHLWPQSLFNNDSTVVGESFNLRPCNPSVNSSRGNSPYGTSTGYWDPDHGATQDRGIVARAMFFMETRYAQLTLVNGLPSVYHMGDLASLRTWHYQYPVNNAERRRNHLVYSPTDNPSYYQHNRNPYVDHPELVWAIWGTSPNDSQLYVSASAPADGASTALVDLGRVIMGAPLWPAQTVTLHKTGTTPTTYNVYTSGSVVGTPVGPRQAFVGGSVNRDMLVGLTSMMLTPGEVTGQVTIDNTDLTSAGAGQGAADGDDVITVVGDVLAHSDASFNAATDQNTLTVDFGTVAAGSGLHTLPVTIHNRASAPGFTAALDLTAVTPAGHTNVLSTDIVPFAGLAGGSNANFTATLDADAATGTYQATYTLAVADEYLPGATVGAPLVLTLTAQLAPAGCRGDGNCDGTINWRDIDYLVAAQNDNESAWAALFAPPGPTCPFSNLDTSGDGAVNWRDIDPFIALMNTTCP